MSKSLKKTLLAAAFRAKILLPIFLLIVLMDVGAAVDSQANGIPPNIIIILTDDQGYGDLGKYGAVGFKTPELDRMADEGMMFTDFTAADCVCTPSRGALLTGRYPRRVGLGGVFFPWSATGMSPDEVTLAEVLKSRGYATALVGKWHLGHKDPRCLPLGQGFDFYFGIPYSNDMGHDGAMPLARSVVFREGMTAEDFRSHLPTPQNPVHGKFKNMPPLMRNNEVVEWPCDQDTLTKRYTEEAQRFITDHKDRPFFLYMAHAMPHVPLHVSEAFKAQSERGLYGDAIQEIDGSVGQILQTLRDSGLARNTLVFFTSDNGAWLLAGANGGSNGGLHGGKTTTYEGGQRVPAIAWWPGHIPAGRICDLHVAAIDLMPTITRIAGAQLPEDRPIDGLDIGSVLEGKFDQAPRREFYLYARGQAIRLDEWKYREGPLNDGSVPDSKSPVVKQLYNLKNDRGETTNLIAEHPEKAAEMAALLKVEWEKLNPSTRAITPAVTRPETSGVEQQVQALLSRMTLEDKVGQLNVAPEKSADVKGRGTCSQVPNERLGIFPIRAGDGPRGPRPNGPRPSNRTTSGPTGPVSPTGLAIASTWNPELQEALGHQWGRLSKEYGLNALYGPGINMIKDPRSGRNTDYAGEDPFLSGVYGTAMTRGIQSAGVAAVVKHFAANNWESGRQSHNVEVPERPFRELYLPAFQMTLQDGPAFGLMTCYNAINGVWGSANRELMIGLVREEWQFKGFFVSDWGAKFGSAAQAIRAGQNMELPGQKQWSLAAVREALDKGELNQADLDARVAELLRVKLGMIQYRCDDEPSGYSLEEFKKVARRVGGESLVLLKNKDSLLPLKPSQSVALIGPFADNGELMIGNAGSSSVWPSYSVTLKQALEARGIRSHCEQGNDNTITYTGARFETALPVVIEYFNGLDQSGPVVHRETAGSLTVENMEAGGVRSALIENGADGKALRSTGQVRINPLHTPGGRAWTVALQVRLEDQLPDPKKNIVVLWAGPCRIELSATRFQIKNGTVIWNFPLDWTDMDKQWIAVQIVSTGTGIQLFRQGELIADAPDAGEFPAPMQIIFGDDMKGLPIDIDELRTWGAALTPGQTAGAEPLAVESFETFALKTNAADKGIPGITNALDLSLRATGRFTPVTPGKVAFSVEANGGVRIKIDGRLVYDLYDEQKAGGTKNFFWHHFPDTRPHEIAVEFGSKHKSQPPFLKLGYAQPPAAGIHAQAVAAAKGSDVAVLCVGVPASQQAENIDRTQIALPSWQDELVQAVAAVNPRTIVLLFTEGAVDVTPWIDRVAAALVAFHPGTEGGNILADVLYGDVNPSGKLTLTWPKSQADLPTTGPATHYKDTVNEFGYRYFDARKIAPQFPFGFGLSYTRYEYEALKLQKADNEKYPVTAMVTLKNTGSVCGKEVVQVYVSDVKSSVEQPVKELAGFVKVELDPGESKVVEIPLHWTAFQFFDAGSRRWRLEPGEFIICVGGSSDPLPLKAEIRL